MTSPLTDEQLGEALSHLPEWLGDSDGISRAFEFPDFPSAIAFMASLVDEIEAADHHPEWSNVYNRLSVTLRTHDADNKVSEKDIALATLLDERFAAA